MSGGTPPRRVGVVVTQTTATTSNPATARPYAAHVWPIGRPVGDTAAPLPPPPAGFGQSPFGLSPFGA